MRKEVEEVEVIGVGLEIALLLLLVMLTSTFCTKRSGNVRVIFLEHRPRPFSPLLSLLPPLQFLLILTAMVAAMV
jgi:hypothetical protein